MAGGAHSKKLSVKILLLLLLTGLLLGASGIEVTVVGALGQGRKGRSGMKVQSS